MEYHIIRGGQTVKGAFEYDGETYYIEVPCWPGEGDNKIKKRLESRIGSEIHRLKRVGAEKRFHEGYYLHGGPVKKKHGRRNR